jgi:hypothetical protein
MTTRRPSPPDNSRAFGEIRKLLEVRLDSFSDRLDDMRQTVNDVRQDSRRGIDRQDNFESRLNEFQMHLSELREAIRLQRGDDIHETAEAMSDLAAGKVRPGVREQLTLAGILIAVAGGVAGAVAFAAKVLPLVAAAAKMTVGG